MRRGARMPRGLPVVYHRRTSRTPWRVVTTVDNERFTVDGVSGTFDDPIDAKRAAEKLGVYARRVSDGRPINFYAVDDAEIDS